MICHQNGDNTDYCGDEDYNDNDVNDVLHVRMTVGIMMMIVINMILIMIMSLLIKMLIIKKLIEI